MKRASPVQLRQSLEVANVTDKMREEFAAWYLEEVTQSYGEGVRVQAEKNLDWKREDGSFADPMLRLACLAWKASREALVIELPAPAVAGGNCIRDHAIRDAIEAAGLKVKP